MVGEKPASAREPEEGGGWEYVMHAGAVGLVLWVLQVVSLILLYSKM